MSRERRRCAAEGQGLGLKPGPDDPRTFTLHTLDVRPNSRSTQHDTSKDIILGLWKLRNTRNKNKLTLTTEMVEAQIDARSPNRLSVTISISIFEEIYLD